MTQQYGILPSPLGKVLISGNSAALEQISFLAGEKAIEPEPDWESGGELIEQAKRQIGAYFAGALKQFDLPLSPRGTPFQARVWAALVEIPYGQTISYGELARRIEKPTAARAVGAANGRNPLPLVIPCHRVIGSSGELTGYGGGLQIKQCLLELERQFK